MLDTARLVALPGKAHLVGVGLAEDVLDGLVDCRWEEELDLDARCLRIGGEEKERERVGAHTAVDLIRILVWDLDAELLPGVRVRAVGSSMPSAER